MKVKRYIVNDMKEGMIKIKSELGIDAVILNTRKIKAGGFFKFFKKPLLEGVAAVDEPVVTKPIQRPKRETDREAVVREPEIIAEKPLVNQADKLTESMQKNDNNELQELKLMVSDLIKKVETIEHMSPQKTVSAEEKYIEFLTGLDIQESIAKKIIEIVQRQINIHEKNHDTILNAMKVIAREYLGEIKTIDTDMLNKPNVYIFLGPTGVGKTTTLAKIAARLSLIDNKKIGLITADTYRIAAVEQLKTYSEILGIPLEVIYEASELHDAIEKFKDKDYILIDTAGRSHKSKELKSDYDDLVKYLDDYKIFLVMSMTTSFKDMKSIIDSYNFLKEYRLLFTKLDESSNFGNILNLKVLTGKPLSYFTIGQSVPDDIEVADKERIIQYIFDQHK